MIVSHLCHIPKSKSPKAVLIVLSLGDFFCDAPHLTASDKKLGCGANWVVLRDIGEFREIREIKEIREKGDVAYSLH